MSNILNDEVQTIDVSKHISRNAAGTPQLIYISGDLHAKHGDNVLLLTDINSGGSKVAAVGAWMTEDRNGEPHLGAVRVFTKSVQYSVVDNRIRIIFEVKASPGETWPVGIMLSYAF